MRAGLTLTGFRTSDAIPRLIICLLQLALLSASLPDTAFSQSQGSQDCSRGSVIVFGNGMFNTPEYAWLSYNALRIKATSQGVEEALEPITKSVKWDMVYNQNEAWYYQLFEVYDQKIGNNFERLWRWLANLEESPSWYRDLYLELARVYSNAQYVKDDDLRSHVDKYKSYLNEGNRIFIVSHSQGNLYANFAYSALRDTYGSNIGNVQVATPANYVAAQGTWQTFPDDKVMGFVRFFVGALPANIPANGAAPAPEGDPNGHSFIDSYMRIGVSRDLIINDIKRLGRIIEYPRAIAQSGVITITLTWGSQPDVDLHVFEPGGRHVYYRATQGVNGYLDVDDVSGEGPEHYYVSCDKLTEGDFRIGVNYYRGSAPETARIDFKAGSEIAQTQVNLPQALGSSGNANPIIVGTVRVTKDSDGKFKFSVSTQ